MKIVNYEEKFGEVKFPEGFEETLKGLSVEEQIARYRMTRKDDYTVTGWKERTFREGYFPLDKTPEVRAVILREGIVVGALVLDHNDRETPCFAEEWICTYYSEDNNGAGYKTRASYLYLACVPADFE